MPSSSSGAVADTPRVLHVIAPGPFGGAESVVMALASARHARGSSTHIAALVPSANDPFVTAVQDAGVAVHPIVCGPRGYLCEVRGLRGLVAALEPAVLHAHVYRADFVSYLAMRGRGVPLVATFHGSTGGSWRNRFYEWVDRRLLSRFTAVICVSAAGRDWLRDAGVPGTKLHVVQNGHRPPALLPREAARAQLGLTSGDFTAGWIGRLSPEKGPDLLVEAAQSCAPDGIHVVVIGDGPERVRLDGLLRRAPDTSSTVRFVGRVSNAAALLHAFDALVISSRTEGLPMVLLEAMSAGVPVVAFAVGGIPEVVSPDSAWLVPPGDPQALGAALREAARHPAEARRRAEAARRIFHDRFTDARWLAEIERIYGGVVNTGV